MTRKPITIHYSGTLRQALEIMETAGFHHLPVLNSDAQLVGILSDRDCRTALNSPYIMRQHWKDEHIVNTLTVRALMTPAPIVIEPEAEAEEAARMMLNHQVSCLPVLRSETLVGIVTRSDLLLAFMRLYRQTHHMSYE
jgi:acetoin utilization protein AcuB